MLRGLLLSLGCVIAACGIYLAVLWLELYWNLYAWQPKWDTRAGGVILTLIACITGMVFLNRAMRTRFTKSFGGLLALALLGLGLYVLPAEPLSQGLFGRPAPSPAWYRFCRLAAMSIPLLFWLCAIVAGRRASGEEGRGGRESAASDRLSRPDAEAKKPTS